MRLAPGSPAALLPELGGVPRARRRPCRATGRPLRRPSGARAVARRQRVRRATCAECFCDALGRATSAPGCPHATATVEALNAAWGTSFWSAALRRRSTRSSRRAPRAVRAQPRARARLPAFLLGRAAHVLPRRARRAARSSRPTCRSRRTSLGVKPPCDLWRWAPRGGRRRAATTTPTRPTRGRRGAGAAADLMRSLRRRAAVAADGAGGRRGQLAAAQRAQAARARCGCWIAAGGRARRRRGAVLPVAGGPRRGAEQFHSAMLPHGGAEHARLPRGQRARPRARGARRRGRHAGRGRGRDRARLGAWWALEAGPRPSLDLQLLDQLAALPRRAVGGRRDRRPAARRTPTSPDTASCSCRACSRSPTRLRPTRRLREGRRPARDGPLQRDRRRRPRGPRRAPIPPPSASCWGCGWRTSGRSAPAIA